MFNAFPILGMLESSINLLQKGNLSVGGEKRGKWKRKLTSMIGKRNYHDTKVWSGWTDFS